MTRNNRSDQIRFILVLLAATISVAWLATSSISLVLSPLEVAFTLFFASMIGFTLAYSVEVAGGSVSIMPLTTVGAFLIMGRIHAAWAVVLGTILHGGIRIVRRRIDHDPSIPSGRKLIEVTALNLAMHSVSLMSAGLVFERFAIPFPVESFGTDAILATLAFIASYVAVNYTGAMIYLGSFGEAALRNFINGFFRALFFDFSPTVFAPLMALIYTRIGINGLLFYCLAFVISSLIAYRLSVASARLQRRVQELDSLQAVGQALSSSLDLEDVLSAIYLQVTRLIPAKEFYVALYDAEHDEVSFRYVVFNGKRVKRGSRRTANGMTEYVMRTQKPLLLTGNVGAQLEQMGIDHIGRDAKCWMGVPLLAGYEVLGMIALQSYEDENAYNKDDLEILHTIAMQAAIAVQNARLYAKTDSALARRVQELDSILRTTKEGILLLDNDRNVVTANPALAGMFNITMTNVMYQKADALNEIGTSLFAMIQYTNTEFDRDCSVIRDGTMVQVQRVIVDELRPQYIERTLSPVRSEHDADTIIGWLLVFRDMTEEVELTRLREDMTHMLVHDLRSPMTMVMGSLSLIPELYAERDDKTFEQMTGIAQRSSERIMELINRLLDIGRLERGKMPVDTEPLDIRDMLTGVLLQYTQIAETNNIAINTDLATSLSDIRGDRSLLTRAFSNLIDNAIKFTPNNGNIRIWARMGTDERTASNYLIIGIYDSGPSIPEESRGALFEKFQQVSGIKGRRRGTGLGLPFCKLAIEAHGGTIKVDDSVKDGCQFIVTLPINNSNLHGDDTVIVTTPLRP